MWWHLTCQRTIRLLCAAAGAMTTRQRPTPDAAPVSVVPVVDQDGVIRCVAY